MSCSFCHQANHPCIMDPVKAPSCSERVRRKGRCDGVDVGNKLTATIREIRRLEDEEGRLTKRALEVQKQVLELQASGSSL
ncbi:hypothetical protein B0T09DRAFT_351894 [Sordaria sp. MPI-SDFR-AT-0083]|nr:hypothetical protein B0T09DRAFT_351894 [Sordaria sp. MPI-SDFR-AT-0083]